MRPAWSELEWEGEVRLPGISLRTESRTQRCAATGVDPQTGRRDMQVLKALAKHFGHTDFGIYLVATTAGSISVGDAIEGDVPAPELASG